MNVHAAIHRANAILPGAPRPSAFEPCPRWQAVIAVADFIESDPEDVWQFVVRWGSHEDADLRAAVATCVLEHLLAAHFELIFPRVRHRAETDRWFADTFTRCWLDESAAPQDRERFDALNRWCDEHWPADPGVGEHNRRFVRDLADPPGEDVDELDPFGLGEENE